MPHISTFNYEDVEQVMKHAPKVRSWKGLLKYLLDNDAYKGRHDGDALPGLIQSVNWMIAEKQPFTADPEEIWRKIQSRPSDLRDENDHAPLRGPELAEGYIDTNRASQGFPRREPDSFENTVPPPEPQHLFEDPLHPLTKEHAPENPAMPEKAGPAANKPGKRRKNAPAERPVSPARESDSERGVPARKESPSEKAATRRGQQESTRPSAPRREAAAEKRNTPREKEQPGKSVGPREEAISEKAETRRGEQETETPVSPARHENLPLPSIERSGRMRRTQRKILAFMSERAGVVRGIAAAGFAGLAGIAFTVVIRRRRSRMQ